MSEKVLSVALAVTLVGATFACQDEKPADGTGAGGAPSPPTSTLRFSPSSTLMMSPGESTQLDVYLEPAASRDVSFGLIADTRTSLDASLDPTSARSSSSGHTFTFLRAPSFPATFQVRAWLDDETEARRAVSVSAEGFATVRVKPRYAGARDLELWTASVRADTSCAEITDQSSDGPLAAQGTKSIDIDAVPVGPPITVTVRSGSLAHGCVSVARLEPDELREVEVPVTDLPLRTDRGELDLILDIGYGSPAFTSTLSAARARAVAAFGPSGSGDAAALLSAWAATLTEARRSEFEQAVSSLGLAAVIEDEWGVPAGATPLRGALDEALTAAAASLLDGGTLAGRLAFANGKFTLKRVSDVAASESGFVLTSLWTASTEPGDVLVLSGTLEYEGAAWLCAVAEGPSTGAGDLTTELAELARCGDLAEVLLDASEGSLYTGCDDEACARAGCEAALAHALRAASRADGAQLASLAVAMTGNASATENAVISRYRGSWLGTVTPGDAPLSGSVSGDAQ